MFSLSSFFPSAHKSLDPSRSKNASSAIEIRKGVYWACTSLKDTKRPSVEAATGIAKAVVDMASKDLEQKGPKTALLDDVRDALLQEPRNAAEESCMLKACTSGEGEQVYVLIPELSPHLDFCRWTGSGLFDMSKSKNRAQPPTLGQIIKFIRQLDEVGANAMTIVHLSSTILCGAGAVMAGAVMVLCGRLSGQVAWEKILQVCPAPSADPLDAWDRFPSTFARRGDKTRSSLRVVDCLEGLAFARDAGWLGDYQKFDIQEYELLRRRLDASWLIPGEVLAMANPWVVAQNPKHKGLLGSGKDKKEAASEGSQNAESAEKSRKDFLSECTYIEFLRENKITMVHRLNYNKECEQQEPYIRVFKEAGINSSADFAFDDCDIPSKEIVKGFLSSCRHPRDENFQPFALHCMGGLGRTGLMVGIYAVTRHGITGTAFHGWTQLCRPGTIVSERQERYVRFLTKDSEEPKLSKSGSLDRLVSTMKTTMSFAGRRSSNSIKSQ